MSRVLVEPTMPEGPKFDEIPSAAGWLHVCALLYAARNRTDGFIPAGRVYKLTNDTAKVVDQAIRWLTTARPGCPNSLWKIAAGGWEIHDYLDPQYGNPTRAEGEEIRLRKSEAGKLGGQASVESRRKKYGSAQPNTPPEADPEADASKQQEADPKHPQEAPPKLPSPPLDSPPLDSTQTKGASNDEEVQIIFGAWVGSLLPGSRRELTKGRRRAIRTALTRAEIRDCLDAVRGWRWDPWQGRQQNNDLEVCLRENNLERFRDWERGINRPQAQTNGRPSAAIANARRLDALADEYDAQEAGA